MSIEKDLFSHANFVFIFIKVIILSKDYNANIHMKNRSKIGNKNGSPAYRTPSSFKNNVLRTVAKIPKGKTISYKQVAELAGSPKAYRAVGNILNKNYDPKIPCHRVIKSDGSPGGYNKGSKNKIKLLNDEK